MGCFRNMVKVKGSKYPFGVMIAFFGPDGAGKSTVICDIEAQLSRAFARTVRFHLRPHFFMDRANSVPVSDPHSAKPRGLVGSLAKVVLWWFDYVSGYYGKVYPEVLRSALVIFDRYADDLSIDPKRYRYGGPRWAARVLPCVVPRPDLGFVLVADPEVIQARKAEVPLAETARQVEAYRELAKKRGMLLVDTGRPIQEVAAGIVEEILGWLEKQDRGRDRENT